MYITFYLAPKSKRKHKTKLALRTKKTKKELIYMPMREKYEFEKMQYQTM